MALKGLAPWACLPSLGLQFTPPASQHHLSAFAHAVPSAWSILSPSQYPLGLVNSFLSDNLGFPCYSLSLHISLFLHSIKYNVNSLFDSHHIVNEISNCVIRCFMPIFLLQCKYQEERNYVLSITVQPGP